MSKWSEYKTKLSGNKPWDVLNSNNILSTSEDSNERFNICLSCEYLTKLTKQCKKCGCFMVVKTKLENVSCPIGKW